MRTDVHHSIDIEICTLTHYKIRKHKNKNKKNKMYEMEYYDVKTKIIEQHEIKSFTTNTVESFTFTKKIYKSNTIFYKYIGR